MTNLVEKPNWDDAPEWANYLAQDSSGTWWWYEQDPIVAGSYWHNRTGQAKKAKVKSWETTLEKRPSPITSIWELLPQGVKYIAMDGDGTWYGYQEKPYYDKYDEDGTWSIDSGELFYAERLEDLIPFDGSLIQRPD